MLRRKESPGADDVFQELDGQVLQMMIPLKVLAVFSDPGVYIVHHISNVPCILPVAEN